MRFVYTVTWREARLGDHVEREREFTDPVSAWAFIDGLSAAGTHSGAITAVQPDHT